MSYDKEVIIDTLLQIIEAVDRIEGWNTGIVSSDSYGFSPEGMKTLAATCMLLEAIGEGVKKLINGQAVPCWMSYVPICRGKALWVCATISRMVISA